MKRIVIAFCSALVLAAMVLAAQPGHGPHMGNMEDHIAAVLNLNASQKAALQRMSQEMKTKAEPLMKQEHQQREEIDALLESSNPDPMEVGNKVIAAHALRAQLKALHDDFKVRFTAVLTEEQKVKAAELEKKMHGEDGHGFGHHGPSH